MSKASSDLTNAVIAHIYKAGGYAWRASSVGVFDTKQMRHRAAAKKGVADVLSVYHGILIAVEIKIGTDRLSDEQEGFMRNIAHHGGRSIIAKTEDQFKEAWAEAVKDIH